jgi:hypothetical protein
VHAVISYAMVLRVPLFFAALLFVLPFIAFRTSARSLLAGLFDLTPGGMLVVTLAALATGETIASSARVIWLHSSDRLAGLSPIRIPMPEKWLWITLITALPMLMQAYRNSARQPQQRVGLLQLNLLLGVAIAIGFGLAVHHGAPGVLDRLSTAVHNVLVQARHVVGLGGYLQPPNAPLAAGTPDFIVTDHLLAAVAFGLTATFYAMLGIYGRRRLGRERTVPALCSALVIIMLLCWSLSAISFFFELYRVPVLLIILIAGIVTAQSSRSDHFYSVIAPQPGARAPDSAQVIATAGERVIVVAANGGGIQAAAWTAQVLQGLVETCGSPFRKSLRFVSSVSGGSVGTAFFVNWLSDAKGLRPPAQAAAESSMDEVAWGLAWPDLLRGFVPWIFRFRIARGRALEVAWVRNSTPEHTSDAALNNPLSSWSKKVAEGDLPAVTFNATLTETGERLLLSTTCFRSKTSGRARVDGSDLHPGRDLSIVTAARLSASFPYVTPAARSDLNGAQPHVVDGGYYDNYGMATLVEWLDDALSSTEHNVKEVLVLQIHGAQVPPQDELVARRFAGSRGWFYQAFAPISTLLHVRSAGQLAHNDVEFALLQEKWRTQGVRIQTTTFEFPNEDAPLSWHLTPAEQEAIGAMWSRDPAVQESRAAVEAFLGCKPEPSAVKTASQ